MGVMPRSAKNYLTLFYMELITKNTMWGVVNFTLCALEYILSCSSVFILDGTIPSHFICQIHLEWSRHNCYMHRLFSFETLFSQGHHP